MNVWHLALAVGWLGTAGAALAAVPPDPAPGEMREAERLDRLPALPPEPAGQIDRTGRKEQGRASYYARFFYQRRMSDGRRMNPNADIAASKTLPLGSVVEVTNLDNGRKVMVRIEDRGPYVRGRVVDLAPIVAGKLDFIVKGIAPVEVKPITVPEPNGSVKLGAGAAEASPREVQQAMAMTKQLIDSKAGETVAR